MLEDAAFREERALAQGLVNAGAVTGNALHEVVRGAYKAGTQGSAGTVDALLREGADQTIVAHERPKASGFIGKYAEEDHRLAGDVERMHRLLANAPADRAWRRRGYLVLCRAHPDRVQHPQVTRGTHHAVTVRRARSRAGLAWAGKVMEHSTVDEDTGGDRAIVLSKVLRCMRKAYFGRSWDTCEAIVPC
eukprot:g8726.t1